MKILNLLLFMGLTVFLLGVGSSTAEEYVVQFTDYPPIGTQVRMLADSTGDTPVTVGSPGPGQEWEFKQELKGKEITYDYVDVAATPFAATVPGSELAIYTKQWLDIDPVALLLPNGIKGFFDVYYYQKSSAETNQIVAVGIGADVSPYYSGGYPYQVAGVDYQFPLSIGQKWLRKGVYSAPAKIGTLAVTLMMADSAWKEVDAYGRLSIPYGTFDCVRIKSRRYLTTKVNVLNQWVPMSSDTLYVYEWFTRDAGLLLQVSSHGGEKNENFTNSGYIARLSSSNKLTAVGCTPDCGPVALSPVHCSLGQNYPNPFNPSTSIPYTLTQPSRIELSVFTLLGQEAAVLDAGVKPEGAHSIAWNGRDASGNRMPSGVYFYRLKTTPLQNGSPEVFVKKMIMAD
jgi:hypothetical protein